MKKILYTLVFMMVASVPTFAAELFYTDSDFPPFAFVEKGEIVGIDIDIAKEISKRTGVDIKVEQTAWKRLLNATKQGQVTGSFSLFQTDEREGYANYALAKPMHYSTYVVFVKKGKEFAFNSVKDLFGKKIAIPVGFAISDEFDAAKKAKKIKVPEFKDNEKFLKLAGSGGIDGFVGNLDQVLYQLKKSGRTGEFVALPTPVKDRRGAFLVISKKGKYADKAGLLKKIDDALTAMYSDGTIDAINDKYTK
jgi:ABC-type amino acid transport substrate-binding protein